MKKVLLGVLVGSLVLTPLTGEVYAKGHDVKKNSKQLKKDKDSNGIDDAWQSKYHLGFGKNIASKDNDKDSLTNLVEYQLNLNPISKDSDKDKIADGNEDKDNDGLTNLQDLKLKLSPLTADSDKDATNDGNEDNDADSLYNKSEFQLGYNPLSADSDKDGINDGNEDKDNDGIDNDSEFQLGYNPSSKDSDKDGINDGNEDKDNDGVTNKHEIKKIKIKIENSVEKKLSIEYKSYKNKYEVKIKDEIGIGDVKSLIGNLKFTPDMTQDEITNQITQVLRIDHITRYELEVKFQSGKELKSEFENKQDDQKQDDNDNNDSDDVDSDNI